MDCMGCDLEKIPVLNEQNSIVTLDLQQKKQFYMGGSENHFGVREPQSDRPAPEPTSGR